MNKRVLILGIPTLVGVIGVLVNLNLPKIEAISPFYFANVEALTGEYSGPCKTVESKEYTDHAWNCDCAEGVFQAYPREYTSSCAGDDGGSCRPGSRLVYYNCDGTIEKESDDRSTAYCPND